IEPVDHPIIADAQAVFIGAGHSEVRECAEAKTYGIDLLLNLSLKGRRQPEEIVIELAGSNLSCRSVHLWASGLRMRTRPSRISCSPRSILALNSSLNSSS